MRPATVVLSRHLDGTRVCGGGVVGWFGPLAGGWLVRDHAMRLVGWTSSRVGALAMIGVPDRYRLVPDAATAARCAAETSTHVVGVHRGAAD